ncbi:hypothetical protein TNCV_4224991 [Trichonephila clavipes]|uniref:Uncharacterized protein n=1 Tax=Trichonephila clavipes TaxID=2585209 RepID=A0A8X6SWH6_TRICX|nr:hypothetical protein TNCV_4224991 [Trichonephila clavipes]
MLFLKCSDMILRSLRRSGAPMEMCKHQAITRSTAEKNPEGSELTKNGRQNYRQVAKRVTKNDANLALSPRFLQVPIESPL